MPLLPPHDNEKPVFCRVDFKSGKFVEIKSGMRGEANDIQAWNDDSRSEEVWMVREEDDRMDTVFGLVRDQRYRAAGMSAQP